MMKRRALLLLTVMTVALVIVASPAWANTFTVNSTGDENDLDFPSGTFDGSSDGMCDVDPATGNQCTFRSAIQQANRSSDADTVNFDIPDNPNIPGLEVKSISPASPLPPITKRVTIDGFTQSGAVENTNEQGSIFAQLAILLDGHGSGAGLQLNGPDASNSVIRGLVINRFFFGIWLSGGTGYKVEGNFIGTRADGFFPLGNGVGGGNGSGVFVFSSSKSNIIGDSDPSDGSLTNAANTIAFNGVGGVAVGSESTGNRILSNSIHSNGGLGIDLLDGTGGGIGLGVTANDPKDPDTGPNHLQNFPHITSALMFNDIFGDSAVIEGDLNSTPSTRKKKRTFIIQFFNSSTADSSGYGEGPFFLGQTTVKTDRQGNAPISFSTQAVSEGDFITATATNKATGDTSEFSEAMEVKLPVAEG